MQKKSQVNALERQAQLNSAVLRRLEHWGEELQETRSFLVGQPEQSEYLGALNEELKKFRVLASELLEKKQPRDRLLHVTAQMAQIADRMESRKKDLSDGGDAWWLVVSHLRQLPLRMAEVSKVLVEAYEGSSQPARRRPWAGRSAKSPCLQG